jgi:hypothetical protein
MKSRHRSWNGPKECFEKFFCPPMASRALWLKSGLGTSCRQLDREATLSNVVCEEIILREIRVTDSP